MPCILQAAAGTPGSSEHCAVLRQNKAAATVPGHPELSSTVLRFQGATARRLPHSLVCLPSVQDVSLLLQHGCKCKFRLAAKRK